MAKGPVYGEFTFPKSDVTYVKGYARGGKVSKPAAVMKERPQSAQKPQAAGPLAQMLKVGGSVRKASMNMSPKARTDSPPKSVNVKARMSLGAAGSPENLACGGKVKKYAAGGRVHPDLKEDKALIKKAFGMHDTQLHESKKTNLAKLKKGGMCG